MYKLGKGIEINGSDIIGLSYGDILDLNGEKAVLMPEMYSLHQDIHDITVNEEEIKKDNREIQNTNDNQAMSYEEIEFAKSKGVKGREMIEKIISNSKTFDSKTDFSKEK